MARIIFFDDRFHEVYGAQENMLLFAEQSIRAGHEVCYVTTAEGAQADAARERGLRVEVVEAPAQLRVFEGTATQGISNTIMTVRAALRYSKATADLAKRERADVVFTSAVRPTLMWARVGIRRHPPILMFAQNSTPFGLLAAIAALLSTRIGLIASGARPTFPRWIQRILSGRFTDLASGRDLTHFAVEHRRVPGADRPLELLTMCSLTERKGLHVLIDAMAKAKANGAELSLTVVGGTTGAESQRYAESVEEQAIRHDVAVDFVGWQDDPASFYAAADVFVLASFHEGLPGVLLEALAAGLPCITTNAGGSADAVLHGETGWVVNTGDADAFGHALVAAADDAARGAATLTAYGTAAQRHANARFSVEAAYGRFDAIIEDLLA